VLHVNQLGPTRNNGSRGFAVPRRIAFPDALDVGVQLLRRTAMTFGNHVDSRVRCLTLDGQPKMTCVFTNSARCGRVRRKEDYFHWVGRYFSPEEARFNSSTGTSGNCFACSAQIVTLGAFLPMG